MTISLAELRAELRRESEAERAEVSEAEAELAELREQEAEAGRTRAMVLGIGAAVGVGVLLWLATRRKAGANERR
jgi:ABC-type transport system involved in cytochrome bd biosynthesis fused ATPase/permease subunit